MSKPGARQIIASAIGWAQAKVRLNYQLIITLTDQADVIGCAGLRTLGYPEGEAEVGIEIDPENWGRGYASEALACLIELAHSPTICR